MEIINNTPVNSGFGDNLKVAFDKVKANFAELYNLVGELDTPITETSQLTNDGADGDNPFITALDIPTSWDISSITGLQSSLNALELSISNLEGDLSDLQSALNTVDSNVSTLIGLVAGQNALIASQNLSISTINTEIVDIKQRLDILEA